MSKTKKLLALLLAILTVVTMLPISAVAVESQTPAGEQYETDGWIAIGTAEEFLKIGVEETHPATGNYYLTDNIDFSNLPETHANYSKIVNGVYTDAYLVKTFNGNLDGRGKTLSGFAISTSGAGGVFYEAATAAVATISNLNIGTETAKVNATIANANNVQFGFLVGSVGENNNNYKLVVKDVHVFGDCIGAEQACGNEVRCGGLIGYCKEADVFDSSFTGKIDVNITTAKSISIGGIVGDYEAYATRGRNTVIKNCDVNATLTATHTGVTGTENVGGIVGHSENISFIDGCTVSGTYTGATAGGVIGSVTVAGIANPLFVITDNNITATVTNDVYGTVAAAVRLYVSDCSDTQDTATVDITENTVAGDLTGKVGIIDSVADIKMIGAENGLPLDGFYRLKSIVSMNDEVFTTAVIDGTFNGVFDGDGFAITDLIIKPSENVHTGFFKDLSINADSSDSVITDLTFGTSTKPAVYEGSAEYAGILAGQVGYKPSTWNNKTDSRVVIDGIDAYIDMTVNGATNQIRNGGLIGHGNNVYLLDCNTYGEVRTQETSAKYEHRFQLGGMIGTTESTSKFVIYNCNNFANVTAEGTRTSSSSSYWTFTGGIVALYYPQNSVVINVNNFGTIANAISSPVKQLGSGGLFGFCYRATTAINCANFGNVYSTGTPTGTAADNKNYAGGFAGDMGSVKINLSDFGQFGEISENTECEETATAFQSLNSKVEYAVTMKEGASVRLSADTGLRFEATVSTAALERIEKIFGENTTVSHGILIAPKAFVTNAGVATHKALDAYYGNVFAEGQKAYIEIISDQWFKGNEGDIAGSITGLPTNNYDTEFVGVGFLTVSVDGTELVKLYAANAQTRDICYVAKKALDDTTTTNGEVINGYTYDKAIEVGETYYVDGTAKVFAEGDTAVYSCYTRTQRDTLNQIINDAN